MSASGTLANSISEKTSKRDEEQKKILQLKQRLDALKKDAASDRCTKEELQELHKKCESILSLTRRIAETIESKIEADRKELAAQKLQLQSDLSQREDIEQLNDQIKTLKRTNSKLQRQCAESSTANEQESNWKQRYEEEKKRADEAEKEILQLKQKYQRSENSPPSSEERNLLTSSSDGTNDKNEKEMGLLELKYQNEKLVHQIKHLQCTFENEEALARALYGNLAAEAIPNPNRCGYLTKQGGSVKSWKRRYFVLKDNFLFYYKKPKDDNPTGVVQLEGCTVEEVPNAEERKNCFKINTESRVWLLQADRQIEMDIWIDCISNVETWWAKETAESLTTPVRRDTHTRKKKGSFRLSMYLGPQGSLKKSS